MRKIGSYMAFFGALAIILDYMGRVPILLAWIYTWGDTAAWAIKIGLIVIGSVLFFMGGAKEVAVTEETNTLEQEKPQL